MYDHYQAFEKVRDPKTLSLAYTYVYEGLKKDHFYNPIERFILKENEAQWLEEVMSELTHLESYFPRPVFAYYPPKTDLCNRRMLMEHPKDRIVRTALAIVLDEIMGMELLDSCNANRRASDEQAKKRLTEDFATTSWPNFCYWQEQELNSGKEFLLRSDITAFYDSVSHENLIKRISELTGFPEECPFFQLFRKILKLQVSSYSHQRGKQIQESIMQQGLLIGNDVDGMFANLYLHPVDVIMQREGISYGRYNDDIRIFGNKKSEVLEALKIIQEEVLTLGLNLNSTKTKLHEGPEQIRKVSNPSYGEEYGDESEEEEVLSTQTEELKKFVDKRFEDFEFDPNQVLNNKDQVDYKLYCRGLQHKLDIHNWQRRDINAIKIILLEHLYAAKHAAWLLVYPLTTNESSEEINNFVVSVIWELINNQEASAYSRYRIIHHLLHPARRDECLDFLFENHHQEAMVEI